MQKTPNLESRHAYMVKHLQYCDHYTGDTDRFIKKEEPASAKVSTGAAAQTVLAVSRQPKVWGKEMKDKWAQGLVKLVVEQNWSWLDMNNPAWKDWVKEWVIDSPTVPDRHNLSGKHLDNVVGEAREHKRANLKAQFVTIGRDGWNDCTKKHLDAGMILTHKGCFISELADITGEKKDTECFKKLLLKQLDIAQAEYCAIPVALCTDCGGAIKAARKAIVKLPEWTHLLEFPCMAHQIQLVLNDAIEGCNELKQTVAMCLSVVLWFDNHSIAMTLLRAEQSKQNRPELGFVKPVVTRWSTSYHCMDRLLKQKADLQALAAYKSDELIAAGGPRAENKAKSRRIIETISSPATWHRVEMALAIFRPLCIATNVFQLRTLSLDQVLLTWGKLYLEFFAMKDNGEIDAEYQPAVEAVIYSLENRWAAVDQRPFLAALFLNPFVSNVIINDLHTMSSRRVQRTVIEGLYCKMYNHEKPPHSLIEEFKAFTSETENKHPFSREQMDVDYYRVQASKEGTPPNPAHIWAEAGKQWTSRTDTSPSLADLARRLYSIVPATADIERLFSSFKDIKTAKRNKLSNAKLCATAETKAWLREKRGLANKRQRRSTAIESTASSKLSTSAMREELAPPTEADLFDEEQDFAEMTARLLRHIADQDHDLVDYQDQWENEARGKIRLHSLFGTSTIHFAEMPVWTHGQACMADEGDLLSELMGNLPRELIDMTSL